MSRRAPRPTLECLDDRLVPAIIWVDDDLAQQPAAQYQTIQAAIDAASANDTVLVYPGEYSEQLRIGVDTNGWPITLYPGNKAGGLNGLTVQSVEPQAARITLPASAPAYSAIITVGFSQGVTLDGFAIAGPGAYEGQLFDGVEVNQQASVTVSNNRFDDIGDPTEGGGELPASGGTGDTGVGVYVGADGGGSATVVGNTFVRYQAAGVMVDGPFSTATIQGNTFVGNGPQATRAQFGVQVSQNGSATIAGNTFTGHEYVGDLGADPDNPLTAAGVVVYQAGNTSITGNTFQYNQTGVYLSDQYRPVMIQSNQILDSTLDGINLDLVRGGTYVFLNTVSGSGRDGIHLQSASHDNLIFVNTVTGSGRYGIASVPTKFGPDLKEEVAPMNNIIVANTVSGSMAFDLFAQAANGGDEINDVWEANTYTTKNKPGLR